MQQVPQPERIVVAPPGAIWGRSRIVATTAPAAIAAILVLGTLINSGSFRERFAKLFRAIPNPSAGKASPPLFRSLPPSMSLRARRQNGDLEFTWSRESALIATATSGVISIQDGESKRQIALDSTQVRNGSVLYSPTSDQVSMQLTVTTESGLATESVMVILPRAGGPPTDPLPASKTSSALAVPRPLPVNGDPLAIASKPFTKPPVAKVAPSPIPPILADSAPVKLNLDPAAAVAPGFVSQTAVPPPPTPVTPSQHAGPTVYQPAIVISKPAPAFPPELQILAVTRKVIEVKVTIDKDGNVSKAEAIPQKNVNKLLINLAVNAARLWRFQPARRDNQPVPSETLLQFVFGH